MPDPQIVTSIKKYIGRRLAVIMGHTNAVVDGKFGNISLVVWSLPYSLNEREGRQELTVEIWRGSNACVISGTAWIKFSG